VRSTPSWSGSRTSTSHGDPAPSEAPHRRSLPVTEQVSLDLIETRTFGSRVLSEHHRRPQIPGGPSNPDHEHQAHAPGHAALLIEERWVLVAGDLLSDVLIPLLDLNDTADPSRTTSPRCG
jgi:hypothetical protein